MPPRALYLFSSRLIPEWYNSDDWLHFLRREVDMHVVTSGRQLSWSDFLRECPQTFLAWLSGRQTERQILYEKMGQMIEHLIIHSRVRDPFETIVRDVILYPADGGQPRIIPMTFSEEGSRADPVGIYTIGLDVRGIYGEENMFATRRWTQANEGDDKFVFYHNISPNLPVNATMARLLGVNADPDIPGCHLMWRGDVVLVLEREWPGAFTLGGGAHIDYVDVPRCNSQFIPEWYAWRTWQDFLEAEKEKLFLPWSLPGSATTIKDLYLLLPSLPPWTHNSRGIHTPHIPSLQRCHVTARTQPLKLSRRPTVPTPLVTRAAAAQAQTNTPVQTNRSPDSSTLSTPPPFPATHAISSVLKITADAKILDTIRAGYKED
ncbi:hypothetical protein B0H13DRAFT_2331819 [Mycena leptocephala]|nr:hypothetical protein B0H13DRAFT_2331819 [Mycena leptocephala]